MVFTLDPKDKYLPQGVRRAATTSAIQARRASFSAASSDFVRSTMKASDGAQPTPPTSNLAHGGLSSEKQFSPRSFLHRIRQTKSADSSIKSSLPWPRKISSRAGQAVKVDQLAMPIPDISKAPSQLLGLQPMSMGDDLPIQRPSTSDSNSRPCSALTVNLSGLGEGKNAPKVIAHDPDYLNSSNVRGQEYAEARATPLDSSSKVSLSPSYFTPLEQPREDNSFFTVTPIREETTSELYRAHGCASDNQAMKSLSKRSSLDREPLASNAAYTLEGNYEAKPLEPRFSPGYGYAQFSASYATDDFISPCLESNTTHLYPMSPCHLSQPKTPIKSETGDDFLSRRLDSGTFTQLTTTFSQLVAKPSSHAPPPPPLHLDGKPHRPHAALEGFQGYSVPENAQASALTIRKLPSTVNKPANDNLHFAQHGNKHDLVHSWTNGPEHRMSVLKELVDDLGYLGAMII